MVDNNISEELKRLRTNTGSMDEPVRMNEKEQKLIELIMTNPNITRIVDSLYSRLRVYLSES